MFTASNMIVAAAAAGPRGTAAAIVGSGAAAAVTAVVDQEVDQLVTGSRGTLGVVQAGFAVMVHTADIGIGLKKRERR